jgi:predicted metal-dependent hydrolase
MVGTNGHTNREPRPIPVRRLAFAFENVRSRHWFGGDPFLTHLTHGLSLTFPEGERFFMDAVRHYEKRITSPALRHEVSRFLAQEALHARAHAAFNAWIRSQGFDTEAIEGGIRDSLERTRQERPARAQLAMTCALEHFTAMMAELLLDTPELQEMIDPEVRRLLVWHAIEETEHKAVAFDVYVATGGTYTRRVVAMLLTTLFFTVTAAMIQEHLMRQDPDVRGVSLRLRGFLRLWIYPGWFLKLIPSYLDYFRPNFHPWQREPKSDLDAFRRGMQDAVVKG